MYPHARQRTMRPSCPRLLRTALPLALAFLCIGPNDAQAQTQAPQCKKSKALPSPNAMMSVAAWRRGKKPKTWSNVTYWCGRFGSFEAVRQAGTWRWKGGYQLVGIRVNTKGDGSKGIPLMKWIPSGTYKITVVIAQHGFGSNPVGGLGKPKRRKPSTKLSPPSTSTDEPRQRRRRRTRHIPSVSATGIDARRTKRAASSQTAPSSATTNARRSPTADPTFDNPQGRSKKSKSKHHPGAGSDKGRPDGDYSGQIGGKPQELGGVADAYGSTLTGQSFGDKEGAKGGEGSPGDAGARGAFALFGGILNVPREYRAAVEVALLAGEVLTPEAAFTKVLGKGVTRMTVRGVRKRIRKQARSFADAEVKRLEKQFADDIAAMSAKDRANLKKSTYQQKERQYFDIVEDGAQKERAKIEKALDEKPGDPELMAALDDAKKIEDAAAIKPVEGRMPVNHEYAGKVYPKSKLDSTQYADGIKAIEDKGLDGVRFTRQGYPDYTPWIFEEGGVPADVWIKYSGDRGKDFRRARNAMREKLNDPNWHAPDNYTWHHHEDTGRMLLIPSDLNNGIGHTGGIPHYRMNTGDYDAY